MIFPPLRSFRERFLAAAALLLLLPGAAPAAATDPLGFYTVKIAGRGEDDQPARTHLGIQLLPKIRFAGLATGVSGNTMSFGQPMEALAEPDQTFYLHVLTGPGRGFICDITAFDGQDVVCAADLSGWIAPGERAIIRTHSRLSDIFGPDNRYGLGSGPDAASADNIAIWDAGIQQERVYYFHSDRQRWEERGVVADAGMATIPYPRGLYIIRRSPGNLRIALRGEVGFEPVLLPVRQGANVFSLPVNLSASLANLIASEGPFAVTKGRNATRADLLFFDEPYSGARKGPFYYRNSPADAGWREVGVNGSGQPVQALDMLSTLTLRREGAPGFVLAEGSLEPSPAGQLPIPPDPEPGELPITIDFPLPPALPPDVIYSLEKSTDLQTWETFPFIVVESGSLTFELPPGASRAFYRVVVTLAP